MRIIGGCYCGELKYEAEGEPIMAFQCHCRECQYYAGGGANYSLAMPSSGFRYTKGQPHSFTRSDISDPATREFCGQCGCAVTSWTSQWPDIIMLKVGGFDDPALFKPEVAVFTCEKLDFHTIPDDMPCFDRTPA